MPVPLMDIRGQYADLLDDVKKAACDVIDSGRFILGPDCEQLEQALARYTGAKHAIGCASGSDALLLALMASMVLTTWATTSPPRCARPFAAAPATPPRWRPAPPARCAAPCPPLLAATAVMAAGYAFGKVLTLEPAATLRWTGWIVGITSLVTVLTKGRLTVRGHLDEVSADDADLYGRARDPPLAVHEG